MRKKMLCNKKVFIVLDDVDSDEQLTALARDRKWFGPGSRMIITCRDSHLLRTHEVNHIYKVEQLETTKALQLFSLSAFKKTHPLEDYKDLSMDFVIYAQGLPLALKVLGSFLYEREIDAWKSEKDKLKAIPNPKIMDALQISFDGLQELEKDLFLDMACLFRAHHVVDSIFYEMLESFGHYRIDIDVLVEKSLISKSEYGWLSMHDLLKEMGQEIVRRECPQEPGQRSRLFCLEDLYQVLKKDTGTYAIKDNLKEFDLTYSENLIETPNLTGVPNLEKIILTGCRSLCEVHPSIGSLKRLKQLVLDECSSLEKLPNLSRLECLTEFWAHETAITQIPSINLIPKSICSFRLKGRKLMRDPNYDIGPLVGYQM
ncbi:disease resistance protein Roq1-like [Carya illinoinensis]|uniref:disease resistance protein Roq1-like n=1 Tax=Carya illinoinensis TaxID=32201 RepID=UPI001C720B6F|nr:disease resistance protein Roq1-like [Carya illinoinensis]